MEKTLLEDSLEQDGNVATGDFLPVQTCSVQSIHIGDLDTLDALHGQDAPGSSLPVDLGYADMSLPVKDLPVAVDVVTFLLIVLLGAQGVSEFLRQGANAVVFAPLGALFGQGGQLEEDVEIGFNNLVDAGPKDLYRDLLAAGQRGKMNLAQRGRSHGHRVESGEHLVNWFL